jgi:hypothetical protein
MPKPTLAEQPMTTLRCTAKLLKRLRLPAKLPEPPSAGNPLGEWYADIDFIDREPFVLLLNGSTGVGLVLPGRAEYLRALHVHAGQQFFKMLTHYGIDPNAHPRAGAELLAWDQPPVFANTRDRSLLGSMNQFKLATWHYLGRDAGALQEAAARQWDGFFRHPLLARPGDGYSTRDWQRPLDLVCARLVDEAQTPCNSSASSAR